MPIYDFSKNYSLKTLHFKETDIIEFQNEANNKSIINQQISIVCFILKLYFINFITMHRWSKKMTLVQEEEATRKIH